MLTKLLCADEVASLLGISKSFVYQKIRTGELPSVHIGTAVRVRPEDLSAYIEKNLFGGYSDLSTPPSKPIRKSDGFTRRSSPNGG